MRIEIQSIGNWEMKHKLLPFVTKSKFAAQL